jgi:flagellar biosynthesis protein FlhA
MRMNAILEVLGRGARQGLGAPALLLALIAMMVVPLAPLALDVLFSFNLALSIVILLAVVYVMRPLDFSSFPTVLLLATLLRLALNVASTRVVLLNGHEGPHAAGKVIEAFGQFVVGGNYAVGLIVFIILTIINFIVVTKGAGRVSEVSARFVLDAMPGKQMAIDADLNAGLLTRDEARHRREEVRAEADFYGSMDGASKFIRGDAIAGILILFINILGGLAIGTTQHDLPLGTAARHYTLLTIGDGLVAQIPALLLSTAVAILVTRMSRPQDMSREVLSQVAGQPRALAVAAGLLGLLGVIPGMPNAAFLALAALAAGAALLLQRRARRLVAAAPEAPAGPPPEAKAELSWEDVAPVDALGLEVGYRLIPLVEKSQGGELMARIKAVRRKLTQELGFLVPAVHIRDNLELGPAQYRIMLNGVPLATGELHPDRELALNPGRVYGPLEGIRTKDPVFDLEATWIAPGARAHAAAQGYTVVDPSTIVATHVSHVVKTHAAELLGHEEVQHLLEGLRKSAPKLVEDLTPKLLPLSAVVRVLQNLLAEQVPVRNLRGICEALAEAAPRSQDPVALTASVRVALGRMIVQEINGLQPELPVLTLEPALERMLQDSMQGGAAVLEPALAERLHRSLSERVQRQETAGEPAVLLVPGPLRPLMAKFTRHTIPALHVLAYPEVPDAKRLRLVAAVGA